MAIDHRTSMLSDIDPALEGLHNRTTATLAVLCLRTLALDQLGCHHRVPQGKMQCAGSTRRLQSHRK